MIILDTNVLSEQIRASPSETVVAWASGIDSHEMFTTAVSEAEMLSGVAVMPAGRKRAVLTERIAHIFDTDFAGRILPFDDDAARELWTMKLRRDRKGKPILDGDALIAAIARSRRAPVATRDVRGFAFYGVEIINPWTA